MKGVYVLLMRLERDSKIRIGKLGILDFGKGYYAYVGSGMSSLEKRMERHLGKKKRKFWHVDYFLGKGKIHMIVYSETFARKECELAEKLSGKFEGVPKFGCSDCNCRSHLFFSRKNPERDVFNVFRRSGLKPGVWN